MGTYGPRLEEDAIRPSEPCESGLRVQCLLDGSFFWRKLAKVPTKSSTAVDIP